LELRNLRLLLVLGHLELLVALDLNRCGNLGLVPLVAAFLRAVAGLVVDFNDCELARFASTLGRRVRLSPFLKAIEFDLAVSENFLLFETSSVVSTSLLLLFGYLHYFLGQERPRWDPLESILI